MLVACEEAGRFLAVTAGSDQRVKVWEVRVDAGMEGVEGVEVRRVADGGTAVADVAGVVCLADVDGGGAQQQRTVVVVGVGMEAWRVGMAGAG